MKNILMVCSLVIIFFAPIIVLAQQAQPLKPAQQSASTASVPAAPQGPNLGRGFGGLFRGGLPGMVGGERTTPLLEKLNLSEEQKKKKDEIMAKHKAAQKEKRQEMHNLMSTMREQMNAANFDEKEFRKTHQKVALIQEDLMVNRAKVRAEVRKILTPEQKVEWDKMRQEMIQKRGAGMMGGMNPEAMGTGDGLGD